MTAAQLAAKIDHTLLKPEANADQVDQVVAEALQYGFAAVCVAPIWVSRSCPAAVRLPDSNLRGGFVPARYEQINS